MGVFNGTRAPGGKRKNSGRKPEWFQNRCKELFEKKKLLDFVAGVAAGTEVEQKAVSVDHGVEVVDVRPQIKDRLRAVEMLKDWGYGKEPVTLDSEGGVGWLIVQSAESDGN